MGSVNFKPLTEEDRKRNLYLDKINHAPYFTIIFTIIGMLSLLTLGALLGTF